MPIRNCRLIEAPLASGVPSVTVPADIEALKALPFGDDGGCSNVVPCTLAVHGGVAGAPVAAQVAASLIPATTTRLDVRERKSAMPEGAGKVVWSIIAEAKSGDIRSSVVNKPAAEGERSKSRIVSGIRSEVANSIRRIRSQHCCVEQSFQ